MRHETTTSWHQDGDLSSGYWQSCCSDCGWAGHRYATLAGADEDGYCHTLREFYELGRRARERGEPGSPILSKEIMGALSDLSVEDPRVIEYMTQFRRGWLDRDLFMVA